MAPPRYSTYVYITGVDLPLPKPLAKVVWVLKSLFGPLRSDVDDVASHPPLTSDPTLALGIYLALLSNDGWIVAIARRSMELFTITVRTLVTSSLPSSP